MSDCSRSMTWLESTGISNLRERKLTTSPVAGLTSSCAMRTSFGNIPHMRWKASAFKGFSVSAHICKIPLWAFMMIKSTAELTSKSEAKLNALMSGRNPSFTDRNLRMILGDFWASREMDN